MFSLMNFEMWWRASLTSQEQLNYYWALFLWSKFVVLHLGSHHISKLIRETKLVRDQILVKCLTLFSRKSILKKHFRKKKKNRSQHVSKCKRNMNILQYVYMEDSVRQWDIDDLQSADMEDLQLPELCFVLSPSLRVI